MKFQSKADIAIGATGASNGLWPAPPKGSKCFDRGGSTWVYCDIYGVGIRPRDRFDCLAFLFAS